jgi:hypothetical protein
MTISTNYPNLRPSLLLDFANEKALDPRVTFSRPTTATYYDGITSAVAEQNLITYSQDFTNAAWTKTNLTVTANAVTAPDGTTTGSTLTATGTSVAHVVYQSTATATQTWSCYAQAGTNNFIQIRSSSDANTYANFVITAGSPSVGNVGSNATASIVSVGSNWYRCILTCNASVNTVVFQIVSSGTAVWNESNSLATTVNLWGTQVEQRSSATAYSATTTTAITNYIPVLQTATSNTPRFDNNPTTGESLGLLIEEQRTNLVTYSSAFDNAAWTKTACSMTTAANIAPDGTQTAQLLVESATTASHFINQAVNKAASAITYTGTYYFKAATRTYSFVQLQDGAGNGATVYFNLSIGTISTAATLIGSGFTAQSATITSVGNGWYRCSLTVTSNSATTIYQYAATSTDGSTTSYAGNGYSGIYIWGAQLEAGAFSTSYIPTVASQVTRSADSASMTGTNFSSWYNKGQGTILANGVNNNFSAGTQRIVGINSGGGTNTRFFDIYSTTTQLSYYSNGNAAQFSFYNGVPSPYSLALNYNTSTGLFIGTAQGASVLSNTTTGLANLTPTQLEIAGLNGTTYGAGWIKRISYYPQVVTSAQLQALTGS